MDETHSHAAAETHGALPVDSGTTDHPAHDDHHDVSKHVNKYLLVGGVLIACTALTVFLSYVNFGTHKANMAVGMVVATFKAWPGRGHFHASLLGKETHLSNPHLHRLFRLCLVLAHLLPLVRSDYPLMSLKGFHIVFISFATLLALGIAAWCFWVNRTVGEPIYLAGAVCGFLSAVVLVAYGIWFYRKMKRLRLIT